MSSWVTDNVTEVQKWPKVAKGGQVGDLFIVICSVLSVRCAETFCVRTKIAAIVRVAFYDDPAASLGQSVKGFGFEPLDHWFE
jgi:hypothetical protein